MKPHPECGACLVHWVFERTVSYTPEGETARLVRNIVDILLHETSPEANVGTLCNRTVHIASESAPGLKEHYEDLKRKSNENAKRILPEAMDFISKGETLKGRLARACFLAAAANVAPLNAPSSPYTFKDVQSLMQQGNAEKSIIGNLQGHLENARHVLYVTDNAGEIGFDSLVMRIIKDMGLKITVVVKKQTFFEDNTIDDALTFDLEKLADNIITVPGFLAPHEMDPHTKDFFEQCDLVIAKGTGSYEALHGEIADKKGIYMLKVKCKPIARELGLNEGNIIVKSE